MTTWTNIKTETIKIKGNTLQKGFRFIKYYTSLYTRETFIVRLWEFLYTSRALKMLKYKIKF